MLLIIYMAFTFGILLPILFPICAFALFSIYVLDVIMLTYWYRKPPNFSEELYLKALKILQYAPIPMFAFGYWGLSNVQMFNNIPMKINFPNLPGNPQHWSLPNYKLNQAHLCFLILLFWFIRVFIQRIILFFKENDYC